MAWQEHRVPSLACIGSPVAVQWTENLVFAPRERFVPSHGCEHERTVMTKSGRGTVNTVSTARILFEARKRTGADSRC